MVRVYYEGEHENGGCCTIVFKVANAEPSTEFTGVPKATACSCLTNPKEQRSGTTITSKLEYNCLLKIHILYVFPKRCMDSSVSKKLGLD